MNKLAVIDGDIICYRCAAANEKRSVIATHRDTLDQIEFDTATKFKEWAGAEAGDYDLLPIQTAAPVENALHSLKSMIASITEKAKCDNYHIVLSGKNNFRLDIPLPTQYKSNRKENTKPLQLTECREYLIKHHNAEVTDGVEADEILVGYMYQGYKDGNYVPQCSLDKDAKHGPGWVFDWTTMEEPELITGYGALELILKETSRKTAKGEPVIDKSVKGKGRSFLWFQILNGDAVDGYKPCDLAKVKFGEIAAYNLLKDCTTDAEAVQVLIDQYKYWYPSPVKYKAWNGELYTKDWKEIMQMYVDCAFMRRWEGDRLDLDKLFKTLGVKH